MSNSSRFACPTSELQLSCLLKQVHKMLALSALLAVVLHAVLVLINPLQQAKAKAPRPLTTRFIKRQPRLTKPLELRKVPQAKRQMIRRKMQLAQARMDRVQATSTFSTRGAVRQTSIGTMSFAQTSVAMTAPDIEPTLSTTAIQGTKAPDNKIDLGLEMLDVNSMDTGRYNAMVVQDPGDRQAVKGFVKLARVFSARSVAAGVTGWGSINVKTIDKIRDTLNEFTGLQADFVGSITFDDERLLEVPIILPQGSPNESEMAQLARYLMAGGFIMGGYWQEALEKYGGLIKGKDFWTERLPDDHPIFSCFFDIKGGMPSGYGPGLGSGKNGVESWGYVTGYFVQGRLTGVSPGQHWGWSNEGSGGDSTRQLQMAVNIIVYALTQEGGMTQQLMQMVN